MRTFLSLFITLLVFIGCDNSYDNSTLEPTSAFTVTLAPAFTSGPAALVPVNSQLILHSSTTLNPSTVNETTVYIQNDFGELQAAYISLINQDIIIQPKIYLDPNTNFQIIVTTAVISTFGEHLSANAISTFTSGSASADTTNPTLITTLPLDKSSNIEPYSIIYFQFSEAISPLNLASDIIKVYDAGSNYVSGKIAISGSLLSFTPDNDFIDGINYTAEVNTSTITDLAKLPYLGNVVESMNFTVGKTATLITLSENSQVYNISSKVNCMESTDSTLFVGSDNGLDIITYDLSTSLFTFRSHLSVSVVGIVYDIDLNSTTHRAYVGSSSGFTTIDVTDISNPIVINHFQTLNQNLNSVPVYGLEVVNDHAYLAATTLGLIDLNISNELLLKQNFLIDANQTTNEVFFDVIKIDSSLVVCNYDQGTKMFNLSGSTLTPPSPQALGQDRNLFSILTTDISGQPSYDYFISAGIGGIKYWDSFNGIGLPSIVSASYISKIILNEQNTQTAFANVKGVGIGHFSTTGWTIDYQLLPFDIKTIGYIDYSSSPGITGLLLAADANGLLHSYEIQ